MAHLTRPACPLGELWRLVNTGSNWLLVRPKECASAVQSDHQGGVGGWVGRGLAPSSQQAARWPWADVRGRQGECNGK